MCRRAVQERQLELWVDAAPEVDQETMPAGGIYIGEECVPSGFGDGKQESVHRRDCGGREEVEPAEELGGGGAVPSHRGETGG